MSNPFTQARIELARELEEHGIKAIHYTTPKVIPPVAVILPVSPYTTSTASQGQTLREWNIGLNILLIASRGVEAKNAEELDDLLFKTILLLGPQLEINSVDEPLKVTVGDNTHLGINVQVNYQYPVEATVLDVF